MFKKISFCTKRIARLSGTISFGLLIVLSLTHVPVLPCLSAAWDADELFFSWCGVTNDQGAFLFTAPPDNYETIVSVWTWIGAIFLFIILPYFIGVFWNYSLEKKQIIP